MLPRHGDLAQAAGSKEQKEALPWGWHHFGPTVTGQGTQASICAVLLDVSHPGRGSSGSVPRLWALSRPLKCGMRGRVRIAEKPSPTLQRGYPQNGGPPRELHPPQSSGSPSRLGGPWRHPAGRGRGGARRADHREGRPPAAQSGPGPGLVSVVTRSQDGGAEAPPRLRSVSQRPRGAGGRQRGSAKNTPKTPRWRFG